MDGYSRPFKSRVRIRGRGRKSFLSMLKDRTLFLVVIIGLSPNYVYSFIFKQKQCDTLPVRMVMKIVHCNSLFWRLSWHQWLVLVFGDLDTY